MWLFAVLGLFYPLLLACNFLFFFYWLWRKSRYALYSFCCILLGWTHLTGLIGLNMTQAKPSDPLTVMSYNCHSFINLFHPHRDYSDKQIAFKKRLKSNIGEVEILCLQEFVAYKNTIPVIKKAFKTPHYLKHSNSGTAIFSKYPMIKSGQIPFPETGNSCLWADLKIAKDTIRVYSVHLQSTKISIEADQLRKEADLRNKKTWQGIRKILGKYNRSTQTRIDQTRTVTEHIQNSPYPVILSGDFNDTPISYVYRHISQGLSDNFKEAARGWGATYAGSIPMLRIDYILTSKEKFKVYEHGILDENYSDHYPVYSQLKLK